MPSGGHCVRSKTCSLWHRLAGVVQSRQGAVTMAQFPIPAIFCRDNLEVLRGMNSASVDLIYLDPPFNKGKQFHAPIGSKAEGADFSDIWHEDTVKTAQLLELADTHPELYRYIDGVGGITSRSAKWYLCFMAVRLLEMRRVLKDTGSIYLHCDPTANYLLRGVMDAIFGWQNFKNEIAWCYTWPKNANRIYARNHDTIFFYSKNEGYSFNADAIRQPYSKQSIGRDQHKANVTAFGEGVVLDKRGKLPQDWIEIPAIRPNSKERLGYPTQKPLALLERIIKASSNQGDLVLDPFCGCATTCVAAHLNDRVWIGIDISPKAFELVQDRLERQTVQGRLQVGSVPLITFSEEIPNRTDTGDIKPLTGKWRNEIKDILYGKQGGDCNGCHVHFLKNNLTVDHKIPKSAGGTDHPDNLQLLCGNCNSIKGDRPMEYLKKRIVATSAK